MICSKCGKDNKDDAKFCAECGTELHIHAENTSTEVQQVSVEMKKRKPIFLWLGITALVIVAAVAITVFVLSSGSSEKRYNEKMDLGRKYLEELNYEQAILCFEDAIKIDPKNKEAYRNLADTYIAWADEVLSTNPEKAIKILEGAIDELEDLRNDDNSEFIDKQIDRLRKRIDEIEADRTPAKPDKEEVADLPDEDDITDIPENPYAKLDAGEYEEVLELYLKMLEDDPNNPEIYLVIVEAYLRMGDYDNALYYAKLGFEKTGDVRLKEKVDMIMGGNISDSSGRKLKMTWKENDEIKWWHEYTYDDKGRDKSITVYDKDGNQVDYGEYEYDENGNCIVKVGGYYADTGSLIRTLCYYDESGKIIRSEEGNNNDFWIRVVTVYYYEGNTEQRDETRYNNNGEEIEKRYIIQFYDDYGRDDRTEYYIVDFDGTKKIELVNDTEYDEYGRRIKLICTEYEKSGEIKIRKVTLYDYDENGKMVRDVTYDEDGNILFERNYQ